MSKYLRIGNGDYNIVTKEGGEITLDTTDGLLNGTGKVIVTGDLEVKGDTQTINSTVVENIIENLTKSRIKVNKNGRSSSCLTICCVTVGNSECNSALPWLVLFNCVKA